MKTLAELQTALTDAFVQAGADDNVKWEVEGTTWSLRTCLAKFNLFAYTEGEPTTTKLSLGPVQKKGGALAIPVFAEAAEITRQIAVVHLA